MYFLATSCEKCATFAGFRKKKPLRVWATNLDKNRTFKLPYIPGYKPRIFGGFYKAKVGGSAYIRVYAPQKKITS